MIRYKIYILLSVFFFGAGLVTVIRSMVNIHYDLLGSLGLIQIPLGVMQLITGLIMVFRVNIKPRRVSLGIMRYWKLNGLYFFRIGLDS